MIVRVPASSANLGPGFDAVGMALTIHAELGPVDEPMPPGARVLDEHHPATIAHRRLGGTGELWARCPIPSGRGLGFSGAVRIGGAVLAVAARAAGGELDLASVRAEVLEVTSALEGHADNVAASLLGGVVVAAAGHVVPVPLAAGLDPAIVAWVPGSSTSTDESRRALRGAVPFEDAVFNVGHTALLVAALAAGDVAALRDACEDRLHQDARLARVPASATALRIAREGGAWAAWLSGSGPTVAAMCHREDAPQLASLLDATLEGRGRSRVLSIDLRGAVLVGT